MQHAYNPQNDIDTGQSIKCTAFARKTWPKKNGVSGFTYMVRRYPVKAVKTGNWCLTVCQGVQTLSTDILVDNDDFRSTLERALLLLLYVMSDTLHAEGNLEHGMQKAHERQRGKKNRKTTVTRRYTNANVNLRTAFLRLTTLFGAISMLAVAVGVGSEDQV